MHSLSILTIAISALAASAAVIDSRIPDGIYSADGQVAELTDPESASDQSLGLRDEHQGVGCDHDENGGGIGLTPQYSDAAVKGLKKYCENKANCAQSVWAKDGNVVVYFCRWRDASFDGASLDNALGLVSDQCGNYQGGSYSDDEEDYRNYSYGFTDWQRFGWCNNAAGFEL